MSKLDRSKPFGMIYGHSIALYEQNGLLYDGLEELIGTPKTVKEKLVEEDRIVTDNMANARSFLINILKSGPLSKSAIYKATEENNQNWDSVKQACDDLKVAKFTFQKSEMWKLQEA